MGDGLLSADGVGGLHEAVLALTHGATRAAAEGAAQAAARHSYGKLVAFLAARSRDVAGAEDALSDAFLAALDQWPRRGVPDSPQAWLLTVARRRMVDTARSQRVADAAAAHLLLLQELADEPVGGQDIPDERLALMFACAHPAMDEAVRAPLILQTVLGFDAATIASAFLVAPAAMGQRLVRAKARIRQAGVPFRVPPRAELASRLDAVLQAIYAAFAEGWCDPAGTDARRRNLADEAMWLAGLAARLLPDEPEPHGLLALMLHSHARRHARRDPRGRYVPLSGQDTALWDAAMIDEAEALLRRASRHRRMGRFQLEAAIQSAHAARRLGQGVDWPAILSLYEALWQLTGSPVVAINRAMAAVQAAVHAATHGAAHASPDQTRAAALAALHQLDALGEDRRLHQYQPWWAARGELLRLTGQSAQADAALRMAIGLEPDPAVREFLQARTLGLPGQ